MSTENGNGRASPARQRKRKKLPRGVIAMGKGYAAQFFCGGCPKHGSHTLKSARRHREAADSISLARDLYRKRKTEVREGRFFPVPAPAWDPIFAAIKKNDQGEDVVTGYVIDYIARNRSTFVNQDAPERFARFFAHAPETKGKTMRQIQRADAQRYRERRRTSSAPGAQRRRGGASVTTVQKELSFARSVYYDFNATLEEKGETPIGNPFASRRQDRRRLYEPEPPARTRHLGSYDDNEPQRLWDALRDFIARAKVFGMALSGVDRGPFFAWEWKKDIDWKRGKVRGWRRKGSGQLIEYWPTMNPDLHKLLRAVEAWQLARSGKLSRWVWPNETNTGPDDAREFYRLIWKPARKRAGMSDLRIKDLRHTFATWMGDQGDADLVLIGKELGHRPGSRCTFIYRHVTDKAARATAARMTGLLPALDDTATRTATSAEHVGEASHNFA